LSIAAPGAPVLLHHVDHLVDHRPNGLAFEVPLEPGPAACIA
jgi:hypothetical protein